jgi:uncharacterized membrane-anchored protein
MTLAWAFRTVMIVVAAVATFLLAQTDVPLDPIAKVVCGAIIVAISAINPQSIADRVHPTP